ncbi:hypothetical protein [Streptomyces sp. NPDC096193]|uniref:hypothetical protein n=1 Tax=Streptomyces sp. NPDC096193 TaxID=3155821 RepID=UPI0033321264
MTDRDSSGLTTSSNPTAPPGTLDQLAGHEPSYIPLGFECLLEDGRIVAADGPYSVLNLLTAAFTLAAVLSLLVVGFLDEYRVRAEMKAGSVAVRGKLSG